MSLHTVGGHRELVLGWGGGMSGPWSRKASLRKWHLISGASQTEGQQGDHVGTGMHARMGAEEAAGPPGRGWSNLDFKRRLRLLPGRRGSWWGTSLEMEGLSW